MTEIFFYWALISLYIYICVCFEINFIKHILASSEQPGSLKLCRKIILNFSSDVNMWCVCDESALQPTETGLACFHGDGNHINKCFNKNYKPINMCCCAHHCSYDIIQRPVHIFKSNPVWPGDTVTEQYVNNSSVQ